ncbi:MAG: helix-turn-helix domain-containing protein [Thermoanaerobaculia bacterium]
MGSRRIPRVADRGNLPQALKLLRTRLDVNRLELGRKLGLSKQQLYGWERGIAEPSFAVLRKTLAGMGFDLHDLQDALDAVEDRPPRDWRHPSPGEDQTSGEAGLGEAEKSVLLLFMRFFARLVAEELRGVVPVERA